jgi:hypothetical protein
MKIGERARMFFEIPLSVRRREKKREKSGRKKWSILSLSFAELYFLVRIIAKREIMVLCLKEGDGVSGLFM